MSRNLFWLILIGVGIWWVFRRRPVASSGSPRIKEVGIIAEPAVA